jgi:hypothetical protein
MRDTTRRARAVADRSRPSARRRAVTRQRRTRLLGAALLLAVLFVTVGPGAPAGAAVATDGSALHRNGRVLVLSLPGVTWSDLEGADVPTLSRLVDQSRRRRRLPSRTDRPRRTGPDQRFLERTTGFEPATLTLATAPVRVAPCCHVRLRRSRHCVSPATACPPTRLPPVDCQAQVGTAGILTTRLGRRRLPLAITLDCLRRRTPKGGTCGRLDRERWRFRAAQPAACSIFSTALSG